MLVDARFEGAVNHLLDLALRLSDALESAGISYRIIGGLAVFLHIDELEPIAARLTRGVDIAVARTDLARIRAALESHAFHLRVVEGSIMFLCEKTAPVRSRNHFAFVGERVCPEDLSVIPNSKPLLTKAGILIAQVNDLVQMKLSSFRLIDKVHIQDMDSVGLITKEIEESLADPLRARLAEVRATE